MRNAGLDEAQARIKVARRNISNLRYADDTTLMAESKEELKSQERLKAGGEGATEDGMVGWHHQLYEHVFEQALGVGDGQGSLAHCSPWGRKESDMTEQIHSLTHSLTHADGTTLMAESEEELKSLLMKVKEESEKAGLKLHIQYTKIRASGPITSWQIDGETVETVTDFTFWGSKITADGDCSYEI